MDPSRSAADIWEQAVREQYQNLLGCCKERGLIFTRRDLPPKFFGPGGMEHEIFHAEETRRFWKSTFPDQAGFGPAGYTTPIGYFRRLRLSNRIFGDDVKFEGIWERPEGLSILTSQRYILPDPVSGMPTDIEIAEWITSLGFAWNDEHSGFLREADAVLVQDAHRRNFIRAVDGEIYAIDVQPRLPKGREIEEAIPFSKATKS